MAPTTYLIALGSNRRGSHGAPADEVRAALVAIGGVLRASPVVTSAPVGPSQRRFANAAAVIRTGEPPAALLQRLKRIERGFGRRAGRRWGARVIDLDIVLWSGGVWRGPALTIPHPAFRTRGFVLDPARTIAPDWRDPVSGRTIRQLVWLVDRRRAAA